LEASLPVDSGEDIGYGVGGGEDQDQQMPDDRRAESMAMPQLFRCSTGDATIE
jgi:hypothetical protein